MKHHLLIALALCCALSACGPAGNLGVVDVAKLPPEKAESASQVQVLEAAPHRAELVGVVTATSCQNLFWQPKASEADALAQLKVKAFEVGGNAITGVLYSPAGTSLSTNCWSSVTAQGTAIKVSTRP